MLRTLRCLRHMLLGLIVLLGSTGLVFGQDCPITGTVNIDFNSFAPPLGTCVDTRTFLAGFGITSTSSATILFGACRSDGTSPPGHPFFVASSGNAPVSWTLTFCSPLDSFSFTRLGYASHVTGPNWRASAFDSQGRELSSVSEGFQFGTPSLRFTLPGPGITSVRLEKVNFTGTSFGGPPIVDLALVAEGCGDERDELIDLYNDRNLNGTSFVPECEMFTTSARSPTYSFDDFRLGDRTYLVRFMSALIRQPLVIEVAAGYGLEWWLLEIRASGDLRQRTINSAYRDPERNRNVAGASRSRHMFGDAIDLKNLSRTADEHDDLKLFAQRAGARTPEDLNGPCGYGCVHADWLPSMAPGPYVP
jgi:hypothetical protein